MVKVITGGWNHRKQAVKILWGVKWRIWWFCEGICFQRRSYEDFKVKKKQKKTSPFLVIFEEIILVENIIWGFVHILRFIIKLLCSKKVVNYKKYDKLWFLMRMTEYYVGWHHMWTYPLLPSHMIKVINTLSGSKANSHSKISMVFG